MGCACSGVLWAGRQAGSAPHTARPRLLCWRRGTPAEAAAAADAEARGARARERERERVCGPRPRRRRCRPAHTALLTRCAARRCGPLVRARARTHAGMKRCPAGTRRDRTARASASRRTGVAPACSPASRECPRRAAARGGGRAGAPPLNACGGAGARHVCTRRPQARGAHAWRCCLSTMDGMSTTAAVPRCAALPPPPPSSTHTHTRTHTPHTTTHTHTRAHTHTHTHTHAHTHHTHTPTTHTTHTTPAPSYIEIGRGALATPIEGKQYGELLPNATGARAPLCGSAPRAARTRVRACVCVRVCACVCRAPSSPGRLRPR
jgi:hypothetical protein